MKSNTDRLERLEAQIYSQSSTTQRMAAGIAAFCGSAYFLLLHIVVFTTWIVVNRTVVAFDPYPFQILMVSVSFETIFLTGLLLMGQRRQRELEQVRNKLDLQVNILAEQENSEILTMLSAIMQKLDLPVRKEATILSANTDLEKVAKHIESTHEKE